MNWRQRGIALVAVLWGVMLLAVIAAGVAALTLGESRRGAFARERAEDDALIESAVVATVQRLAERQSDRRLSPEGAVDAVRLGERQADVRVSLEAGRVDINAADDELLLALGESAGLAPAAAATWVAILRDWQDADDARRLNGAEAADYRAHGDRYGPRNAPLRRLDELKLLLGMTDTLYACLEGAATVYTQAPTPALAHLTPGARAAWERFERNHGRPPPPLQPAGAGARAAIDATGQVLRIEIAIVDATRSRREFVVGRLSGDRDRPWISLGRWAATAPADCSARSARS